MIIIRTEQEYQEAQRRLKEDTALAETQRKSLLEEGFSLEEVERGMQPLLSFNAQFKEEIAWYESVCRGHIEPLTRLTNIGRTLIALRIYKGLSQRKLAETLGVSEAMVSRDERNEYHGITVERVQRILDALNVSLTATVNPVSVSFSPPVREDDNRVFAEIGTVPLPSEENRALHPV